MLATCQGALGAAAWGFAGLALLVGSAAAFALGVLRTRHAAQADLRSLRSELRQLRQLSDSGFWQTDAAHRLQLWQAPGQPAGPGAVPFDGGDPVLLARLRTESAFEDLALPRMTEGAQRWALRGVPRFDDLGRFAGFVGSARALAGAAVPPPSQTAAVDAAQGARAAQAAESDNFSFTVSHDLRAPIRVVEGFTRIVKEDYGKLLDRVGNDHLDRVLGAAARMNLMIDALLTLARLGSQPLAHQPVNLTQLATFVFDELKRAAPERLADITIEPGLVAQGDPTLLRLVLENLLGNAWKYSARSPRAQISLSRVAHGAAGHAYVVRDNGAGFDMRSSDRLFGLFQRLHSASEFPGHGVGLASVRRIVHRHGGEIWAEAEPGRGAAFFFTLA